MSGFTVEDQKLMLRNIGKFVREEIRKAVEPLQARIEELEATGIKFVGTYQRAAEYRRGDVCNFEGGMWVATCETPPQEVPGKSVCWQLSVKSYSNGKDHAQRQPTIGGPRPSTIVEKRT